MESDVKSIAFLILEKIYTSSKASSNVFFNMWDLGKLLNIEENITRSSIEYLVAEGLLEYVALGGILRITHQGIREYEESKKSPENPTMHFSAYNQININTMNNSNFKQGILPEHVGLQSFDNEQLIYLIEFIESKQKNLPESISTDCMNQINIVKTELNQGSPQISKIKGALRILNALYKSTNQKELLSITEEIENLLKVS